MREKVYTTFGKAYGVNFDDIKEPLNSFETFVDFFTREVKPREIQGTEHSMVAPADSRILSFDEITADKVLLVKNQQYRLGEFLTGNPLDAYSEEDLQAIKKDKNNKLYSIIFYLSPGDYHRYHSPVSFLAKKRAHILGYLWPVKVSYVESTDVSLH